MVDRLAKWDVQPNFRWVRVNGASGQREFLLTVLWHQVYAVSYSSKPQQ